MHAAKAPRTLAAMAIHGTDRERWAAATHPNTPPQILHLLAKDPQLADKVAENPSANGGTLSMLTRVHPQLLLAVVGNPACPPDLLRENARHPAPAVRGKVGQHLRCPEDVLEHLVLDADERVRQAAAGNPSCPVHARVTAGLLGTPAVTPY